MTFRPQGKPDAKADTGQVLMPKIFRRQVRFFVSQLNHLPDAQGDFRSFLGKQSDPFVTLKAFLNNPKIESPAKNSPNGSLMKVVTPQQVFSPMPGDLVFFEQPSTLVDAAGKKIKSF
jgi:hypothetical protein